MNDMTKVYGKLDSRGNIICINSSAFLHVPVGWTQIDEGYGDRFVHAQSQYLPGGTFTDDGIPRYRWDGEKAVERTVEEIDADRPSLPPQKTTDERLNELAADVNGALLAIMLLSIE